MGPLHRLTGEELILARFAHNTTIDLAQLALKACGTSGTGNSLPFARGLRDLSMGLVQAFPAERGHLEVAQRVVTGSAQALFGTGKG